MFGFSNKLISSLLLLLLFVAPIFAPRVGSKRHLRDLTQFNEKGQKELAETLKQILAAFDKLFDVS